jgi:hypothetical protein
VAAVPKNTVLVLGAGASVADAYRHRPKQQRDHPPLDLNFFQRVPRHARTQILNRVIAHAEKLGQPNLTGSNPPVSLEAHLGRLFYDMANSNSNEARNNYYDLLTIYSDELRLTTSWLDRRSGPIKEVIERELQAPHRVSVLTFNHDLLVENALSLFGNRYGKVWCLRHAYGFGEHDTCANNDSTFDYECPGRRHEHVPILKLHGSLNWVFRTRDQYPPKTQRTRDLLIWNNRTIPAYTRRIRGERRDWYLWSLIVPPIYEKQGFIRDELEAVWSRAADTLRAADKVIFWGYSFPRADVHARYFFQAAAQDNEALRSPTLINPDPGAHNALWDIVRPTQVNHFKDVEAFLASSI